MKAWRADKDSELRSLRLDQPAVRATKRGNRTILPVQQLPYVMNPFARITNVVGGLAQLAYLNLLSRHATVSKQMELSLKETAHRLRMTLSLVSWFTKNPVLGQKLRYAAERFDEEDIIAFDRALHSEWPNRYVPKGISVELKKEACGSCGLCNQPLDHLEEAHIKRKTKELAFYCQHPLNLLLLCPNCHTRYDSNDSSITVDTIKHVKDRLTSRLMKNVDRDVLMEKMLREEAKSLLTSSLVNIADKLILMATGNPTESLGPLDAVEALIATAQSMQNAPLTAGFLMGTAMSGKVDLNVDSFEYIDQLAEPLPTREEFEAELSKVEKDPSPRLIAWAAGANAAYDCSICWTICIEFDVLAEALVSHWQVLHNRDDDSVEQFDYSAVLQDTIDAIANSGVEGEESFDSSGMCSLHTHTFAKNE